MKKISISLIVSFIVVLGLSPKMSFSQQEFPYELDLKKDLIIGGVSGLAFFSESFLTSKIHDECEAYFNSLNSDNINAFDRSTTTNWNPTSDDLRERLMDVSVYGVGLVGALGLTAFESLKKNGSGKVGKNLLTTGVMFFEGAFFVLGVSDLAKSTVNRPRPYAYNPNISYEDKIAGEDYKESFFSGSTAMTSYGMFFTAKMINDLYPDSKWKYAGWGVATAYSGYAAWLATDAGHHFPTDVLVGSLIGAGTAILIPELHKIKISDKDISLNVSPTMNGIYVGLTF